MTAIVRPATSEDFAVWSELWTDYLAFYETSRPEDVHAETWSRIMDPAEEMHCYLAEDDAGRVIGFTNFLYHRAFWSKENVIYLNDLFTRPDVRGTGAGKALILAVKEHAKRHNAAKVYWLTAEDNTVARRLYDQVAAVTPFRVYQC